MKRSTPRIPRQKRSQGKKEHIIKTALKIFSDMGYHKTHSNEIAKQAGVAIGTFYAYFKDKKDLFLQCLNEYNKMIHNYVFKILDFEKLNSMEPVDVITLVVKTVSGSHFLSQTFHMEVTSMKYTDEDIKKLFDKNRKEMVESIKHLLETFSSVSAIKDIDTASMLIYSVLEETLHALSFYNSSKDHKKIEKEVANMLCRYIFQ